MNSSSSQSLFARRVQQCRPDGRPDRRRGAHKECVRRGCNRAAGKSECLVVVHPRRRDVLLFETGITLDSDKSEITQKSGLDSEVGEGGKIVLSEEPAACRNTDLVPLVLFRN
jgi:hypothetical protein